MNTCVMTKLMMVIFTFRMEQGVMTAKVYRTQTSELTSKKALQILQNHDQSLISQIPPWRPQAGETYLISSCGDDRRKNDWSHDGYQWVNKGGDGYPRKEKILWRKYYSISTMPTDKIGSSEFQRTSFKLVDNHSIVLVHYTGDAKMYMCKDLMEIRNQIQGTTLYPLVLLCCHRLKKKWYMHLTNPRKFTGVW